MMFKNRIDAGRQLGERLSEMEIKSPVVVIGLARGGVVVAAEIGRFLHAPLDVLVVRKLGAPGQPELAVGAIAEGGFRVINESLRASLGLSGAAIDRIAARAHDELERRLEFFRRGRPAVPIKGRTVVIVDDGMATGATAGVAARAVRAGGPSRVILAVPVASPDAVESLSSEVDEVVCLETSASFFAIGQWYEDFEQVSDDDVVDALDELVGREARISEMEVQVDANEVLLPGVLSTPAGARALVIFAHGSGSSRLSPRNKSVAHRLNEGGLATLLVDLLAPAEEADRENVFDVSLLAWRLRAAAMWARRNVRTNRFPIGYFGASTGAAAALWAAAEEPRTVSAVVCRGGRPDLAGDRLTSVRAPTLLVVGANDTPVLELNVEAKSKLQCVNELKIVPGASHLFSEPGALESVAELATAWFRAHLIAARRSVA